MQMLNDLDKSNEAMQTFYALFTQSNETPKEVWPEKELR